MEGTEKLSFSMLRRGAEVIQEADSPTT